MDDHEKARLKFNFDPKVRPRIRGATITANSFSLRPLYDASTVNEHSYSSHLQMFTCVHQVFVYLELAFLHLIH